MKPMLAKPFKERWWKPNGYLQPKLDGMRMIWTGEKALSRRGKEMKGAPALVSLLKTHFAGQPLDGELFSDQMPFEQLIGSLRRTKNIQEDFRIGYWVYDIPIPDQPFSERLASLHALMFKVSHLPRINVVPSMPCVSLEECTNIYVSQGYEGTMWRDSGGLYAFGKRSGGLLKLKDFQDAEFEVVRLVELQNYEKVIVPAHTPGASEYADGRWWKNGAATPAGTTGGIICRTKEGLEFEVGTGMSDEQRAAYWASPPIGEMLTIKYFELTARGAPRFPVHIAIRNYE